MQELELLHTKLDILLKKYASLKAENKSLKDTVSKQLKSIEKLSSKLEKTEESLLANKIRESVTDPKEKASLRKQLDTVIGEIDKILTTLND